MMMMQQVRPFNIVIIGFGAATTPFRRWTSSSSSSSSISLPRFLDSTFFPIQQQQPSSPPPPHFSASLLPRRCCFHITASSSSESSLPPSPMAAYKKKDKFCQFCGSQTKEVIPDGDERMRSVCTVCGKIHYENPKMVVGCLVEHDGKILLCKRNIQPSYGLWTLPAGYLEIGESAAEGASRETLEEANAEVEIIAPFAQLDIPHIGQSYIIFRAKMKKPYFSPGPESLECMLFALDEIPFGSLAFSSMHAALKLYIEDVKNEMLKFHYCTINKRPGASLSDPDGFDLENHLYS